MILYIIYFRSVIPTAYLTALLAMTYLLYGYVLALYAGKKDDASVLIQIGSLFIALIGVLMIVFGMSEDGDYNTVSNTLAIFAMQILSFGFNTSKSTGQPDHEEPRDQGCA